MSKFYQILCFLTCFVLIQNIKADNAISLETKVLGNDIIFVFYHDKTQLLDLTSRNDIVYANISVPSEIKLINENIFNTYTSNLILSTNRQSMSFQVNDTIEYVSVINGEKLDAIKFRLKQKQEGEDLTSLSSAQNDPSGVKYEKHGEVHNLIFSLSEKESNAAIFCRGKYLWIIFDEKKIFSFEDNGIFKNFETIQSSSGTVIRVKMEGDGLKAKLAKDSSKWVISIAKNFPATKEDDKHIFKAEALDAKDGEGLVIKGNFNSSSIIDFQDPEIGDNLNVIVTKIPGARIKGKKDFLEFSVLPSIQGVVIAVHNDEVKIKKTNEEIKIISNISLPDKILDEVNNFPTSIDQYLTLPTILPYLDENLDILDFNQQKSRLISDASEAKDASDQFDKNLDLARFYFIHSWYQESLDALLAAKLSSAAKYQQNLQARFLTAVNYTMIDDNSLAQEEYDALLKYDNIKQIAEINLWNKYNNFSLGSNTGSVDFLNNFKSVSYYSNDKYWPILFAEIELALLANDLKFVERLLRDNRGAQVGSKYANSLKFYQAEYYRKKEQYNLAKQFYKEVMNSEKDLFNSTRAKLNFVKLKVSEQEISTAEAINSLEALRFAWRGDQLEYEILMQLASYYRDNNDIMNSLRVYQYIQNSFNNKISNFYITSEMARIFNQVFLPGGLGENMDDFTIVALFYEFKELNPIGQQGDDVIISIAKRLVKLDLLENAAGLLRHQIKFRLQGEKRINNADNLAIILLMDNKPNEAMMVLDDTDRDNFNFKEHMYRTRLRARAMIDLESYTEAIKYLKDDDSADAEILRREALFQSKNWDGYIDRVSNDLDNIIQKIDSNNTSEVQDILRLAISYYMLNMQDSLTKLTILVETKNQRLKNTIDLLITSSEPIDYKNLDKTLNVDQMKGLLDKYKNKFLSE